jgi:YgiT-type zinc finger domain-containing protein
MRCSIQGCPGQYEAARIVHTVHRGEDIFVFEHVPADVCSVCGDTLLSPGTVKRLEELISGREKPARTAPVYEYA